MILYNVTLKIDPSVHDKWLTWMKETHIPDVMATGYFTECRMSRLLGEDESDGQTYSVQYGLDSMKALHQYQINDAPRLKAEHGQLFGEKVLAYRSMMEVVWEE